MHSDNDCFCDAERKATRKALASASAAYTEVSPGGGEDGPNKVGWSITQNATAANA